VYEAAGREREGHRDPQQQTEKEKQKYRPTLYQKEECTLSMHPPTLPNTPKAANKNNDDDDDEDDHVVSACAMR